MKPLALILAVVFAVIAVLYWVGHTPLGQHAKHGILFIVLALLCLVWYRFQSAAPAR
jgi:ABC-type transport system involved in cytochrome bd biosynthesis fused ATPase/permease subunit